MIPAFGFGAEFHPPTKVQKERCRKAIANAVWGRSCRMRSVELLFTVVLRGAGLDPLQALDSARRLLAKHPNLQALFEEVYELDIEGCRNVEGPVGVIREALKSWGWTWPSAFVLRNQDGLEVPLLRVPRNRFLEQVEKGARRARWRALGIGTEKGS